MLLKIKALIYQLTGIYLAKREEREYLRSINQNRPTKSSGLILSVWQAKNGFYRAYPRHYIGNPKSKKKTIYGKLYPLKFSKSHFKSKSVKFLLFWYELVYSLISMVKLSFRN